jgi:hypothetical protein
MWLRILGIALAVWIVLSIIGALFKFLTVAIVIGAVVFVGAAAYSAVRSRSGRSIR